MEGLTLQASPSDPQCRTSTTPRVGDDVPSLGEEARKRARRKAHQQGLPIVISPCESELWNRSMGSSQSEGTMANEDWSLRSRRTHSRRPVKLPNRLVTEAGRQASRRVREERLKGKTLSKERREDLLLLRDNQQKVKQVQADQTQRKEVQQELQKHEHIHESRRQQKGESGIDRVPKKRGELSPTILSIASRTWRLMHTRD